MRRRQYETRLSSSVSVLRYARSAGRVRCAKSALRSGTGRAPPVR